MTPYRTTSEWRKLAWPVALAATLVWCSNHSLGDWARPRLGEDKLEHLLVFGLMATLLARLAMLQRTRPFGAYAAVLVVSAFGLTDELHQHFTPRRTMDVYDWLADTCGALLATALYVHWGWYRRLLETPVWALWTRPETTELPKGLLLPKRIA